MTRTLYSHGTVPVVSVYLGSRRLRRLVTYVELGVMANDSPGLVVFECRTSIICDVCHLFSVVKSSSQFDKVIQICTAYFRSYGNRVKPRELDQCLEQCLLSAPHTVQSAIRLALGLERVVYFGHPCVKRIRGLVSPRYSIFRYLYPCNAKGLVFIAWKGFGPRTARTVRACDWFREASLLFGSGEGKGGVTITSLARWRCDCSGDNASAEWSWKKWRQCEEADQLSSRFRYYYPSERFASNFPPIHAWHWWLGNENQPIVWLNILAPGMHLCV